MALSARRLLATRSTLLLNDSRLSSVACKESSSPRAFGDNSAAPVIRHGDSQRQHRLRTRLRHDYDIPALQRDVLFKGLTFADIAVTELEHFIAAVALA